MSLLVGWPGTRLPGGTLGGFIIAVRRIHCWAMACCSVGVAAVAGLVGCLVAWLLSCWLGCWLSWLLNWFFPLVWLLRCM